ncbi:MAG: nucleoside hydrolase [Pirellulales bacterium]
MIAPHRLRPFALTIIVVAGVCLATVPANGSKPVRLIFDTDIGNDIDDALALGVIHALASRGECELLAVTISKDNDEAAAFVDAVNHFYGRGDTPIGVVRNGKTPNDSRYLHETVAAQRDGQPMFPRSLDSGADAPEATALLRRVLAEQPDDSVVFVVVGFSTNVARLLESPPDDVSPLSGADLVARKCRLLSIMAGMFSDDRHKEYNVFVDVPAARQVYADWPTPIVASGYEIGRAIKYPAESIERDYDYVDAHPLSHAYRLYHDFPYDRETWDLTSVLYAVHPDRGYFDVSDRGTITVDDESVTQFQTSETGQHRYLIATPEQRVRVLEALVQLASQPPDQQP